MKLFIYGIINLIIINTSFSCNTNQMLNSIHNYYLSIIKTDNTLDYTNLYYIKEITIISTKNIELKRIYKIIIFGEIIENNLIKHIENKVFIFKKEGNNYIIDKIINNED